MKQTIDNDRHTCRCRRIKCVTLFKLHILYNRPTLYYQVLYNTLIIPYNTLIVIKLYNPDLKETWKLQIKLPAGIKEHIFSHLFVSDNEIVFIETFMPRLISQLQYYRFSSFIYS